MKSRLPAIILTSLFFLQSALAEEVMITNILSPQFTEVEDLREGTYMLASSIVGLKLPVRAKPEAGKGTLTFNVSGKGYRISRADVMLANEQLVVDACKTVPVTLATDARSASVKGAGEGCQ